MRPQPVDAIEQVVALDVGDAHVDAEPVGDVAHPLGAAGRVEPAGVADDLDATIDARAEDLLHLGQERRGVAGVGVARLGLPQDEHRQLGQPVAGEHVDRAALDHLPRRRQPVAVEARAVGDPDRALARHDAFLERAGAPARCRPARRARRGRPSTDAVGRRDDLVLHLHRLDDDERLPGGDRVAGGDEHAQHVAGHRRDERAGGELGRRVRVAGEQAERHVPVVGVDEPAVAVAPDGVAAAHAVDLELDRVGIGGHDGRRRAARRRR